MPDGDAPALLVWVVNQGVAFAVCAFVLVRLDKRLEAIHKSLDDLTLAMLRTGALNGDAKAAQALAIRMADGGMGK